MIYFLRKAVGFLFLFVAMFLVTHSYHEIRSSDEVKITVVDSKENGTEDKVGTIEGVLEFLESVFRKYTKNMI